MRLTAFLRENAPYLSAGFLLTFGSAFGQTYFISVFAGEIRGEFGLTHAAWGQIYSIGTLISAAVMVWAGAQVDRFRIRATGLAVLLGLAFACLFMAGTPAAWALIPAIFLLRFTGQGMMSHLGAVSMARWFVASRGGPCPSPGWALRPPKPCCRSCSWRFWPWLTGGCFGWPGPG